MIYSDIKIVLFNYRCSSSEMETITVSYHEMSISPTTQLASIMCRAPENEESVAHATLASKLN